MRTLLSVFWVGITHVVLAQVPELNPEKMNLHVEPFYNSEGTVVAVGSYSDGLSSTNHSVFLKTIRDMKKNWSQLTVEELYVAAIRLYDLKYRDESVYWFYSAQLRSRVLAAVLDPAKNRFGSPAFELVQAQNAFYQLSGPNFNGYAFKDPDKLLEIISRVRSEAEKLPSMDKIYPKLSFLPPNEGMGPTKEIVDGLAQFGNYLRTQKSTIKQQRLDSGVEQRFMGVLSQDFPDDAP